MSPLLVLILAVAAALAAESPMYTSKYDTIDLDKILNNDRILTNYIKCLMEEGSCTNEGRELKKLLPDALQTGCSKCNEKQKKAADRVIKHLTEKRPKDWDRLKVKYDPTGEFSRKYEDKFPVSQPAQS